MQPTAEQVQQYLLGPLVQQWFARLRAAEESKSRFTSMAKLCRQFLGSSAKAMWEDSFRKEFYPGIAQPQFMVSLNKAFELVAIIGPSLYWQNPTREVRSMDQPDQTVLAQMVGVTEPDMLDQIRQMQEMEVNKKEVRNSLASAVMEHIQQTHPGGVKIDLQLIIQDALVTGRGCGWTETYTNPSTGEVSVGTFFDSVDNLLVDPDAKDPAMRDVTWMSRRHIEPVWVVERRFGYPPGYLKGKGTHISSEYSATERHVSTQGSVMYKDLMEWYEVWSIAGVGARVTGVNATMGQALDQLTGDYAYLCMTRDLTHPLNLPHELVLNAPPEGIQQALLWRTSAHPSSHRIGSVFELCKVHKWPVQLLDFYPVTGTCWPMAVLGPGIGSLLAMNIILVSHLSMSWDRRRDIITVLGSYAEDVERALQGESNPAIIKINSASNATLNQLVGFLQRPEVGGEPLAWLNYLDNQFQMATGLDDIHYGISQKQARVSSDVEARTSASNVRPDKMANDVHEFVVQCGTKELWLSGLYIRGGRLVPLLGVWGAAAWDMFFGQMPLDQLAQEIEVWVEAMDMKRPSREKDIADLNGLAPFYLPLVTAYSERTGDEKPLNAFLHRFAVAMQMRNPEDLYFGPWHPMPDPAAMEQQQQMLALEAGKTQAEIEELRAKTTARLIDAQYKSTGAAAPAMARIQWNDILTKQKMQQSDEMHALKLVQTQEMIDAKNKKPQK